VTRSLTQLIITCISGDLCRESTISKVTQSIQLTRHEAQAETFCGLVEQHFGERLSMKDYADEIGVSAPHLTRVCRSILGSSPNDLVRRRRLLEAKRLLEYTRLSVSEISARSGFRDPSFFSRSFSGAFGVSPKTYREDRDR
jgi:AraC family transcriptional activator of pobA